MWTLDSEAIFREALDSDIQDILSIRQAITHPPLKTDLTHTMLKKALSRHCKAWVVELEWEVVGFALANRKTDTIWGVFVLPDFRQRGLGQALVHFAECWLFSKPARRFWQTPCQQIALTTPQGSTAERFYQQMGFHTAGKVGDEEVIYTKTTAQWQRTLRGKSILDAANDETVTLVTVPTLTPSDPFLQDESDTPTEPTQRRVPCWLKLQKIFTVR